MRGQGAVDQEWKSEWYAEYEWSSEYGDDGIRVGEWDWDREGFPVDQFRYSSAQYGVHDLGWEA